LWDYVRGDAGTHGKFNERSLSVSPELWLRTHVKQVGVGLAVGIVAAVAAGTVLAFGNRRAA
jgi:hypothetical protein